MGYNITISSPNAGDYNEKTLYFQGDHTSYFEELEIEPEDFNGMTVKEIIPYYMTAKKMLEDEYEATNDFIDEYCMSQEYSGKYWERDDPDVVLGVVNNTQHTYTFN
jgi:hypothetical protein